MTGPYRRPLHEIPTAELIAEISRLQAELGRRVLGDPRRHAESRELRTLGAGPAGTRLDVAFENGKPRVVPLPEAPLTDA